MQLIFLFLPITDSSLGQSLRHFQTVTHIVKSPYTGKISDFLRNLHFLLSFVFSLEEAAHVFKKNFCEILLKSRR